MLRWIFLSAGVAAFAIMLAVGSQLAVFVAFGLMFGNFATMCLQYDGPLERARSRVAATLLTLQPHSDAHQRMETVKARPTSAERRHPMNVMTALNVATGLGCVAMLAWAVVLWAT